jgi:hypothetical protein
MIPHKLGKNVFLSWHFVRKLPMKKSDKENPGSLNSNDEQLTPDKLRKLTGLDVTDEKAHEIIHSIRLLCKVLYQFSAINEKSNENEDQQISESLNKAA